MDLLQIWRKIWRHRIVTLPVITLTLLGAYYLVAVKAAEYEASSSYVVLNPPPPPTPQDIARNPALKRINPDNPYARFSDQTVLVSLLSTSMNSDSARQRLSKAGADPGYTVAPAEVGPGQQVEQVDITGKGSTPQKAVQTAQLVGAGLTSELDRLQAARGVEPYYRVKTQEVVAPDTPKQAVAGKLRGLVGVLGIGAILLLIVVSAAEALATLRGERGKEGMPQEDDERDSLEGAPIDRSQPHQGRRNRRLVSRNARKPTMDGMTGLTQSERILRALSFRGDGTPAPPGEVALPGAGLRKLTGIKSGSMYAVTSKLRKEGKIERDERGWWRLRTADNGHSPARAARAPDAENGTWQEGVNGSGRTRGAPDQVGRRGRP